VECRRTPTGPITQTGRIEFGTSIANCRVPVRLTSVSEIPPRNHAFAAEAVQTARVQARREYSFPGRTRTSRKTSWATHQRPHSGSTPVKSCRLRRSRNTSLIDWAHSSRRRERQRWFASCLRAISNTGSIWSNTSRSATKKRKAVSAGAVIAELERFHSCHRDPVHRQLERQHGRLADYSAHEISVAAQDASRPAAIHDDRAMDHARRRAAFRSDDGALCSASHLQARRRRVYGAAGDSQNGQGSSLAPPWEAG